MVALLSNVYRRTFAASIGAGVLGSVSGCLDPLTADEEYSIELRNTSDSDRTIRVQVTETVPAPHGGGSFHDETYNLEAREKWEPIPLDAGSPATMRIVVDDELIRIVAWPASRDSPGEIASNAVIYFGSALPTGQNIQVLGD